jgi:hypothetical protein
MSVTQLLSRVVVSDDAAKKRGNGFTNTIASDALTRLAVVFSALIHDVDHTGLPNARLVAERAPAAVMYDGRSMAEKKSICIAWEFLMRPESRELRACIGEVERFCDLVRDAVIATDSVDKDLKEERNVRWNTVFGSETTDQVRHADPVQGNYRVGPYDTGGRRRPHDVALARLSEVERAPLP